MNQELQINSYDIIHAFRDLNNSFVQKSFIGSVGFLGCQFVNYFKTLNEQELSNNPCHLYAWDNYIRGIPSRIH